MSILAGSTLFCYNYVDQNIAMRIVRQPTSACSPDDGPEPWRDGDGKLDHVRRSPLYVIEFSSDIDLSRLLGIVNGGNCAVAIKERGRVLEESRLEET